MSFFSWSTGKVPKETKAKKLKVFPTGDVGKFYWNLANNVDGAVTSNFYSRVAKDADVPFSYA